MEEINSLGKIVVYGKEMVEDSDRTLEADKRGSFFKHLGRGSAKASKSFSIEKTK